MVKPLGNDRRTVRDKDNKYLSKNVSLSSSYQTFTEIFQFSCSLLYSGKERKSEHF